MTGQPDNATFLSVMDRCYIIRSIRPIFNQRAERIT